MKYSLVYLLDHAKALRARKSRTRAQRLGIATMEIVMIVAIAAIVIGSIFVVANQGFGKMKELVLDIFNLKTS